MDSGKRLGFTFRALSLFILANRIDSAVRTVSSADPLFDIVSCGLFSLLILDHRAPFLVYPTGQ